MYNVYVYNLMIVCVRKDNFKFCDLILVYFYNKNYIEN